MEKVVTIPYGYEELPAADRDAVVPICIARFDEQGHEISQGWFDAVNQIQDKLRLMVRYVVRDVRRTSEVVEPAVHSVWRAHGDRLGRSPEGQIYSASRWSARKIREQDEGLASRTRRVVAFGSLEASFLRDILTDPTDYEALYQRELLLAQMNGEFLARGLNDVSEMYELLRDGNGWNEIGARMDRDPHTAQRRFRRWRDKIAHLLERKPDDDLDPFGGR